MFDSMRGLWLLLVTSSLASGVPVVAQVAPSEPCPPTVLNGRVDRGDTFRALFGNGLVFLLEPEVIPGNPQGWTVRVTTESDPLHDLSFVATPPYRFWNPRYVDTSYGVSAEAALAMSRRDFRFVLTTAQFEAADRAVSSVLWPAGIAKPELEAARSLLERLPARRGTLWIRGGSAAAPDGENPLGSIEWMEFQVELCR